MLLSDEKMTEIQCKICGQIKDATCKQYPCSSKLPAFGAIAKAQLIAAWDWLNEPCKEHSSSPDYLTGYQHRYLCPQCRAEFEAEVKKIKSEVEG